MKDMVTPVPPDEVKGVIRKCLEQAAQLNYQRIKDYAKIEGNPDHSSKRLPPKERLENVMMEKLAFPQWSRVPFQQETLLSPDILTPLHLGCNVFVSTSQMICSVPRYL